MLWATVLWLKAVVIEEIPEDLNDNEPCTKGLAEEASLRRHRRRIFPGGPVHDIPGGGHEQVGEIIAASVGDVVIVVVVVFGLIYLPVGAGVSVLRCFGHGGRDVVRSACVVLCVWQQRARRIKKSVLFLHRVFFDSRFVSFVVFNPLYTHMY